MTSGKGMAPFSRHGRIKANSAAKELNVANENTKGGAPNLKYAYHKTAHFFNRQNDYHSSAAIIFDYVSPSSPPLTPVQKYT